MSRAFKNGLVDEADDLSTGAFNATGVEKLSGADLEQLRLAALNNTNPSVDANGNKTLGTSLVSARLATVVSDAANTVTVDDAGSLFVGQVVDIVSPAGVVRVDSRTLTAVNFVTKTATYIGADASASVAAGDYVTTAAGGQNVASMNGADLERWAGEQ